MDSSNFNMLSQFVAVTNTDPGLAQDLLEGQNWNWDLAMQDFKQLQDIGATPKTTPMKTPVSHSKSSPIDDGDKKLLSKPVVINNGSRSPGAPKKLVRGISKANNRLVGLTRQEVVEDEGNPDTGYHLVETPMYTFVLPDLEVYTTEFRSFIEKDLLEMTTMVSLENAACLNWWANACPRLWPMATTGDGNCLLHAASLGMWGFHDRQLTLRKALCHALTENTNSPRMQRLKRRWRWQQTQVNKESGLVYSEEEWDDEWKSLLKLASAEPRLPNNKNSPPTGGTHSLGTLAEEPESPTALSPTYDDEEDPLYESLEEFHVFVLANILQRPILVVADTVLRDADGEAFAPIPFGGIYLPLDCQVHHCQKTPLVLTYDAAHFSALVPMESLQHKDDPSQNQAVIPVTDHEHKLLPLHFSVDPGPNWQWDKDENDNSANPKGNKLHPSLAQKLVILKRYLDLVMVPIPGLQRDVSVESSKSENGLGDGLHRQISTSSSESERFDSKSGKDRKLKKKASFGQKLKFFSGLEKGPKTLKKNKAGMKGSASADNINADRAPHITIATVEEKIVIVGAKMTERRHQLHEEMIANYLQRAKVRFEEEQKLLRMLENEKARHNQAPPRSPNHQQPPRSPRISPVMNHNQMTNSRELPRETHHNPRRDGVPNRNHNKVRNAAIQTSRIPAVDTRGRPISQPVRHHQQQQPQVPQSIVYVNRQANPKHSSNAMPNNQGRGRYPPPAQLPPGMRPAPLEFPPGMRAAPQQANRTSPDGRMSVPDGRLMVSSSSNPGNRSPKSPQRRPVSQPPLSSHPKYDVSQGQKSQPRADKSAIRGGGGDPSRNIGARAGPTKPCRSPDCDFYGTHATDFFCSKCYQSQLNSTKPTQPTKEKKEKKKKGGAFWKK